MQKFNIYLRKDYGFKWVLTSTTHHSGSVREVKNRYQLLTGVEPAHIKVTKAKEHE